IDAKLIYDFDISKECKFEEEKDGTIDFRNLNKIINVNKDDILCHIIPVQEGIDGIDVYGKIIRYKPGKTVAFNNGNNTYISEDGLKLLSSTDGSVELVNNKVYVESIYRVDNVDNETGNIDFVGSVVVIGDVKEGFSITAKGDIKIKGMVEGAYIKSEGNVVINKGMNGMGKGTIYAKGDITSKYIENATIVSDKSVFAEALINSDVKAKESIILRGSNAAIIGGTCQAAQTIYAKTIGSKTNAETNVILNLTEYQEQQKEYDLKRKLNQQLEKKLNIKNKEIKEIDEKADIIANSGMDINNKNSVKKQLILMKVRLNKEIQDIKQQLEEIIPTDNIANHKIICKGLMYANTRISIGWIKHRVRQDISHSKIYNDGNDILIVPLNPSDIES
ncbi:MAG: FapA family protein, partial [Sedimentibacter sp.]